jgi:hypothetical protein
MANPEIKILAVSNVYCRLMNFLKKGDVEEGHFHDYDHGTLLATGKVLVEKFDADRNVIASKIFTAPTFLFIEKDVAHRLTAMEDNTVATCIHALRSITDDILDPDTFVQQQEFSDVAWEDKPERGIINVNRFFQEKRNTKLAPIAKKPKNLKIEIKK